MKKTFIISALAAAAALSAGAKTADELRVYINPGHGSWTPDDRPNVIVGHEAYTRTGTDTTSFFESNTNLRKGFGVLERLVQYGLKFDRTLNQEGERWQVGAARDLSNNIVMSHVKCGPYHDDNGTKKQLGDNAPADITYYNRNLSEISQEVISNNFDMFISIHSNALNEGTTTNYPLYLYRGYDSPKEEEGLSLQHQQTSKAMADASWKYAIENTHSVWTAYTTNTNIRGDINFYNGNSTVNGYKGYLGVLKHNAPGFLVEGYFHTYNPARHRAMNWDVCAVEGTAYARGIADYFGLQKEATGTIYGIVRDMHEKFNHDYYKPNPSSDDIFKPLNGCTVILKKDGQTVATYTTDNNYNGAFVFDGVEPGTYDLEFSMDGYKEGEPAQVTVGATQTIYPKFFLENKDWVPATKVYETYPDPAATIKGVRPANEYAFTAEYTDVEIPELEGKTVRRILAREGLLYILAIDKLPTYAQVVTPEEKPVPTIVVYNPTSRKVVANVSTEGAYGSIQDVADIQLTDDNILLATCQTKNQYDANYVQDLPDGTKEPRGTLYVYKWANDEDGLPTGNPEEWISTQLSGRWYRSYPGGTFAYKGTLEDGYIMLPQPTISGPVYKLRSTLITVSNAQHAGQGDYLTPNTWGVNSSQDGSVPGFGENYRLIISPLAGDPTFYYVGPENIAGWDLLMKDNQTPNVQGNATLAGIPGSVGAFKYAGASYMVIPSTEADGKNTGLKLVNISDNVDNAVELVTYNTTLDALEAASVATVGETAANYDLVNECYTEAWINLYVLRDGKITKVTTRNTKQPVNRTQFAYGLAANKTDDGYELTYNVTDDATGAELVLTPVTTDTDAQAVVIPAEATKGAHTVTVANADLAADTDYTWAVNVESKPNAVAGEVFAENHGLDATRGGAITITDPTVASFGYTLVCHGRNPGIDIYNPAGEKVSTRLWKNHAAFGGVTSNQSNPFRGAEREGKVLLPTWGDAGHGIVVVDPLAEAEPYGMFAGTHQSGGHFIYNGVNLGGGTAGICVVGKGDNTRIYSFSEDHEGKNGSGSTENTIVRYNVGNNWQITEAPEMVGYKSLLSNTNVDMRAYGEGFFASQCRGAGNNAQGTPCFVYIDSNEDVTFNSATITGMESGTSGIAITTDGKTLAAAETNKIGIYDVTWDGETPSLELAYYIPFSNTLSWSNMSFDHAGNLHAYERENGGYHVYSLVNDKPVVSTPAPLTIQGQDGVANITVDNNAANDADAVYYNLNGMRMDKANMVPGVYVKVTGNVATKVIVK